MSSPFPHVQARMREHDAAAAKNAKNSDSSTWSPLSRVIWVTFVSLVLGLQAFFAYKVVMAYRSGTLHINMHSWPQQIQEWMFAEDAYEVATSDSLVRRQIPTGPEHFFMEIGWSADILKKSPLAEHVEHFKGWSGICAAPFAQDMTGRSCKVVDMHVGPTSGANVTVQDCTGRNEGLQGIMNKVMGIEDCRSVQATTVGIDELLKIGEAPKVIDYIFLDTHGTELQVLQQFPFHQHCVRAWSINDNNGEDVGAMRGFLETAQGCRIKDKHPGAPMWARCPCTKTRSAAVETSHPKPAIVAMDILPTGTMENRKDINPHHATVAATP